jgi:hypothetical protein
MDVSGCTIDMCQPITLQSPPGTVPDGMKVTSLAAADQLTGAASNPALAVGSFTLWPFSYDDNRVSFGMVMYDPLGKVVASVEKPGARYIVSITISGTGSDGTVTFTGQANQSVTLTCADIDALLTDAVTG